MRCEEIRDHLVDFIEDELNDVARRAVEEHLRLCPPCRAERESLQRTLNALSAYETDDPGDLFWAAYPAQVGRKIEGNRRRRRWAMGAVPVIAVAAVMAVVLLFGREDQSRTIRGKGGAWAPLSDDMDYLSQLAAMEDSLDVEGIVVKRLVTEAMVAGASDSVLTEWPVSLYALAPEELEELSSDSLIVEAWGTEGGQTLERLLEEYRIQTVDLEDLLDELEGDEADQLMKRLETSG